MNNTSKLILLALLAGMVAVSGCNKKNRKAEGAGMDGGVSTSGTGTEFGPDGQPLGDWQNGASGDLLSQTTIHFAYDSSELDADSQVIAEAHAKFLSENSSITVVLEGHADERGTREYNMALGERRANAVANYLIINGVERYRVETVSYGEERPVNTASTDSAWSENRRVELK